MARLVMKFGGTSVADIERIRNVARHVEREVKAGHQVAVVVSAMAGHDRPAGGLVPRGSAQVHDAREYDAIVASGEQVTAGLLAIVLQDMGIPARSWHGLADADADRRGAWLGPDRSRSTIRRSASGMEQGQVAVDGRVPGRSAPTGASPRLGRGGSDTSAVALAAALDAALRYLYRCGRRLHHRPAHRRQGAAGSTGSPMRRCWKWHRSGAKVLQTRSVELAMVYKVPLQVRSSFEPPDSPIQNRPDGTGPGTIVCDEDEIVEQQVVSGIAYSQRRGQGLDPRGADQPGVSASIFGPLAEADINVDMIVQNVSTDGKTANITFTVPTQGSAQRTSRCSKRRPGQDRLWTAHATDVAKVSVIGIGMRSHAGVAARDVQGAWPTRASTSRRSRPPRSRSGC